MKRISLILVTSLAFVFMAIISMSALSLQGTVNYDDLNSLAVSKNVPEMGGSSSGDVNGTFVPTGRIALSKNVPEMGGSSSGDVNGTFVPTGRIALNKNVPEMGGSSSGDVNGTFVPTGRIA